MIQMCDSHVINDVIADRRLETMGLLLFWPLVVLRFQNVTVRTKLRQKYFRLCQLSLVVLSIRDRSVSRRLLSVKNLIKIHNKNIIAVRFSSKC